MYTFVIYFVMIGNIFLTGVVIFNEKRETGSTWAWLLVLILLPLAGLLIYLVFGRQLRHKNSYAKLGQERRLPPSIPNEKRKRIDQTIVDGHHLLKKYSKIYLMYVTSFNTFASLDNEVIIFRDGHEKFDALFQDIRKAKKEINIQYYTIQPDELGKKLRDSLIKKAMNGVKIRILYDEIGSRRMNRSFFKELMIYGGEVHVFFPSFLKFFNFHLNNRNHRKACIIDGSVAYIGGLNIGNEYLGLNTKYGYWRDTHLRIKGEAVNHIQQAFILDWYQTSKQQDLRFDEFSFRNEKHNGNSPVQVITSGPYSETEHLKNMYIQLIMSAKESVYIQTPYFIPDPSFLDACKIALLAGVDIRIMIPNKDDKLLVYWATRSYVGELLAYGARILLYEKGFLHAKAIVVDQEIASVGSANIDVRSFKLNFEMNTIIYDKEVSNELYHLFMKDSQVSSELTINKFRERSFPNKCMEAISRLFSPIL